MTIIPQNPLAHQVVPLPHTPHPQPTQTLVYFLSPSIGLSWAFPLSGVMYVVFHDWILLLNGFKVHPHWSMYQYLILFIDRSHSIVWIYCILLVHSSVWWTSGLFQLWPIMSNATVNICIHMFVWLCFHFCQVHTLGVKLLDYRETPLNTWRNCHAVFRSGRTISHLHGS